MGYDYGFGELENQLIEKYCRRSPDLEVIRSILDRGVDVNAVSQKSPYRDILSTILNSRYYPIRGRLFFDLIRIFMDRGFDLKRFGLSCIGAFTFLMYERPVFDVAKLLLSAGVEGEKDRWEAALEGIGTEESYQRCCENDHASENVCYAFYELVETAFHKGNIDGVDTWQACIGLAIEHLWGFPESGESMSALADGRFRLNTPLVFQCGMKTVVVSDHPNIYIQSAADKSAERTPHDLSLLIPGCVGAVILSITFDHKEIVHDRIHYSQPIIRMRLDSGTELCFTSDAGEVEKEDTALLLTVHPKE